MNSEKIEIEIRPRQFGRVSKINEIVKKIDKPIFIVGVDPCASKDVQKRIVFHKESGKFFEVQ